MGFAAAGLAAIGIATAAAAQGGGPDPARRSPRPPHSPDIAVVHRSTEDPAEVQRHWTPERIRQADENMRNLKRRHED